jgi:hypothetical protein
MSVEALPSSESIKPVETKVETPQTKERLSFWTFINSSFALWLLSTVVVGLSVYGYQSWQTGREAERKYEERVSQLTFEAAGRLSHYLTWSYSEQRQKGKEGKFKPSVTPAKLKMALESLAGRPSATDSDPNGYHVKELLHEFHETNLISIFTELKFLNEQEMKKYGKWYVWVSDDLQTLYESSTPIEAHVRIIDPNVRKSNLGDIFENPKDPYYNKAVLAFRKVHYDRAIDALIDPDVIIGSDNPPSYDKFKSNFETHFLLRDIRGSNFAYVDCFDC